MWLLKYYLISFFSMIHTFIKILRLKYVENAMSFFREHNVGARKLREGWKDGYSRTWVPHFHVHRGNLWSSRFDNSTSIPKSEHTKPSLQNWGRVAASSVAALPKTKKAAGTPKAAVREGVHIDLCWCWKTTPLWDQAILRDVLEALGVGCKCWWCKGQFRRVPKSFHAPELQVRPERGMEQYPEVVGFINCG